MFDRCELIEILQPSVFNLNNYPKFRLKMKTKKKTSPKKDDLEAFIAGGKATVEETAKRPNGRGRPKSKIKKIQCLFYLPENIVRAVDTNCMGNKSVFVEKIIKEYFDSKGIKY